MQKIISFKSLPHALSYSQAAALMVIDHEETPSQSYIASHLHLEPASVVSIIDSLEKLKLVKRQILNHNRRKYKLSLTKKGRQVTKQLQEQAQKLDDFFKKKIAKKDLQNFTQTLDKLTTALNDWEGGENEIYSSKRPLAP